MQARSAAACTHNADKLQREIVYAGVGSLSRERKQPRGGRCSLSARVSAGDFVFGVFYFFAEGKNREELVAAGDAAKGGYPKRAPEAGAEAIGKFAGDALDFNIAADGAVSCEKVTERSRAGTEANGTAGTSPGNGTDNAGEVVEQCSSTRAAASCGMTNWTVHPVEALPG